MFLASMGGLFLNMNYSKEPNCELFPQAQMMLKEIKKRSNKFEQQTSSLHNEGNFFFEITQAIDNAERAIEAFKRKVC